MAAVHNSLYIFGYSDRVIIRFSTAAGGAGSVDTPRDVRGFAVKFYTQESTI